MKTKILAIFMLISLLASSAAFADDLNKYTLEFNHHVINKSSIIKDIEVELMSFSKDVSPYYRLLSETTTDGTNLYKEYSAFTYVFKGLEPEKLATLKKYYDVNLYPMNYSIDSKKVTTNLGGNESYLNPEQYIVSNDPLILSTAKKVVGTEKNPYEKARLLYAYVASEMMYDANSPIASSGSYSAIRDILRKTSVTADTGKGLVYDASKDEYNEQTFKVQEGGLCFDYATLLVALLRAEGIPSRVVVGYVVTEDNVAELKEKGETNITKNPHAWVEIYLAPYGWIHVDPTITGLNFNQAKATFAVGGQFYLKQGYNFPFIKYSASSLANYSSDVKLKTYTSYKDVSGNPGESGSSSVTDLEINPQEPVTPSVTLDREELTKNVLDKKKSLSLYYDSIQNKIDKSGVIDYVDSKITENTPMTRARAFSLLYLITEIKGPYSEKTWVELSNHWAKSPIEFLAGYNLVIGYVDGTVKPDKIISEKESAIVLNSKFDLGLEFFSNKVKDFLMGIRTYLTY